MTDPAQPSRSPELNRLVVGRGRYVGDVRLPGTAHLAFVRCPWGHARIRRVSTRRARSAPGVLLILTAADLPPEASQPAASPTDLRAAARPMLAGAVAHSVGVPVAAVVAETEALAADAAALVEVEYEELPTVTDPEAARRTEAPIVHPELGTNVAFTLRRGSGDVARAFATATRVVERRISIPRVAAVTMEPTGILVDWDGSSGRLTAWCTTQTPWRLHGEIARVLGLDADAVRVIAPDVGGGFGVRVPVQSEWLVVALAARRLARPIRWQATRQEDFVVTQASREAVARAALAVDAAGRFVGLSANVVVNMGAYCISAGHAQRFATLLTGAYDIPAAGVEVCGVYTNTTLTGAYRGAGRPEAAFVIEQLVEAAAIEAGIDSIDLRRRNFVPPSAFPYTNALGTTYDSGDFGAALERALAIASDARHSAKSDSGDELIGTGVASYVEPTGGGWESGRVFVDPAGKIVAITGSVAQGQGHRTTFARIVADRMGARFDDVEVRQGDTDDGLPGTGTFASRSTVMGGTAIARAAEEVYRRGRQIAAHLLEANPDDVVAQESGFSVIGLPGAGRAVTWGEVAAAADRRDLPTGMERQLDARTRFEIRGEAFASGACLATVAIDRRTGEIRLRRLFLAHDAGRVVVPRLLEAQVHGGLAQGAGEALGEWLAFGADGQLLAGSLLDYWIPRASDLPAFEHETLSVPSPLNPLGSKGAGEAGTIGAPAAIANAVLDALRPLGIRALGMPFSPERIWQAIEAAESSRRNHAEARDQT